MTTAHDFSLASIDGPELPLKQFAGKAVLLVNVASRCGYTKQYAGLEALAKEMKDKGVVVIGVPCNQFGGQEPGTEADIKAFCSSTFDVTFPMSKKVDVKGDAAHPLYRWLTTETKAPIAWNFAKFVLGKNGEIVQRFDSTTTPESPELRAALQKALA